MRFGCVVLVTLLAACGGDTGGSSAPPPSEDLPLAPDFEEVYRIGGIEAEGWDAFTEIADMGFDARGHLHIRDGTASSTRIVAVDGAGALLAEYGSMGDGECRRWTPGLPPVRSRRVVRTRGPFCGFGCLAACSRRECAPRA